MKNIAILGSTGSIGKNALEVARHFPDKFRIVGLSANSNAELLYKQIKEFHPLFCCMICAGEARELKKRISPKIKLFVGREGLEEMAGQREIEKVLIAISGSYALLPLLKAIESGKDIALANKEALVMAGPLIMERAAKKKVRVIPVDSEQSAIWQCLEGEHRGRVKTIYLTASGGPFRLASKKEMKNISINKVLRHPRWKMGRKVTVDSASLMNKGLELFEAMFLFGCPPKNIKVLIHPEALVHSMVEFVDGVVLAQLSATDMRIPIQYALSYPERLSNSLPVIDFYKLKELHFEEPDFKRFPCLGLAYRAAKGLGTLPAALNAANEASVEEFLGQRIKFSFIPKVIEKVLDRHRNKLNPGLKDIFEADSWARNEASRIIKKELN